MKSLVTDRRRSLARLLPTGGTGVEVGVWRGDFAAVLLAWTRPSRLHLVDPWMHRDQPEALYGATQETMDEIYQFVLGRFANAPITIHRSTSLDAASLFPDGSLDFVYVDGDHNYEAVVQDLAVYWPKLRPGGVLAGDDYGVTGWWGDGVTRAVDEFVVERQPRILTLGPAAQFAVTHGDHDRK